MRRMGVSTEISISNSSSSSRVTFKNLGSSKAAALAISSTISYRGTSSPK